MSSLLQWPSDLKKKLYRLKKRLLARPSHFSADDFEERKKLEDDYLIVAHALTDLMAFESVFDVGCANGFLLNPLFQNGYAVRGIEVSSDVMTVLPDHLKPFVTVGDFNEATGTYDLVCCVEVAEHIYPRRSTELVEVLTSLGTSYIYFTAAPPGQPGHGHINCRPHDYWIGQFEQRGWHLDAERTQQLRTRLEAVDVAHWLEGNSYIFKRVLNG